MSGSGVREFKSSDRQISWSARYIHFLHYFYTPEQNCVTWSSTLWICREWSVCPRPPVSGFSLFGDIHGKSEYRSIYNSFTVHVETAIKEIFQTVHSVPRHYHLPPLIINLPYVVFNLVWQDFEDKAFHTRDLDFINTISAITIEILY